MTLEPPPPEPDIQLPIADSGMLAAVRADPVGGYALFLLNAIDSKVGALFTVLGILIAALLLFNGQPELRPENVALGLALKAVNAAALGMALVAALLSLSCINIVHIIDLGRRGRDVAAVVGRLDGIAKGRRRRYLAALYLTAATLLASVLLTVLLIW